MVKQVDAEDSKSSAARRAGSIPASGTTFLFKINNMASCDWYFEVLSNPESSNSSCIVFVDKNYWNINQCLEDAHVFSKISPYLPVELRSIDELQESIFVSEFSVDSTRTMLRTAGFIEHTDLNI